MKRVVIVRHGKAVHYGYEDDFNRNLQGRGEKDATRVSMELNRMGIKPDLIISSPALRALKTAKIFAENLDYNIDNIKLESDIYEGLTSAEFIELVQSLPDNIESVFFFGHNPGFHFFANNLAKHFSGDMPTTSTVGIEFNVDSWKNVKARSGDIAFHLVPRMFR